MKQKYILFSIIFLGFILLDCAGTQQDSIAKTQNVEFLIEQGELFWRKKKTKSENQEGVPVPKPNESKKKSSFFDKFLKNRLGKSAVQGEELLKICLDICLNMHQLFLI